MPLTPELELVIHNSKTTLGERDRTVLASLRRGGLDWQEVLRLAEWFQVGGFLGAHLTEKSLAPEIPDDVRNEAYRLSEENRVRYVFFIEPELGRIFATLYREKIPVIALKGTALNRLVYRDLGLRPVGDVDLLIEEQHLHRARDLFDELGYSSSRSPADKPSNPDNYHYCPRLLSPDGSVEVELHRHLVRRSSPLYFPIDDFWKSAQEREIGGERAWILGPVDLVSHLCLKFFLDRTLRHPSYAALRQLADIAETLDFYRDDFDWSSLVRQARSRNHAAPIYCALHTARTLLDLEIEQDILDRLRPTEIDDQQMKLFVERKILDLESWFFHELVQAVDNTGWNLSRASFRRLLPEIKFLEEKYWDRSHSSGPTRLYGPHLAELGQTLLGAVDGGRRIREHLRVDRWMHRLLTESS